MARARPSLLVRCWRPPAPGRAPVPVSNWPKTAFSREAQIMSQARASPSPPPRALPRTLAMVITGTRAKAYRNMPSEASTGPTAFAVSAVYCGTSVRSTRLPPSEGRNMACRNITSARCRRSDTVQDMPDALPADVAEVLDLLLGADDPVHVALRRQIPHLSVSGRCTCGCGTAYFDLDEAAVRPAPTEPGTGVAAEAL